MRLYVMFLLLAVLIGGSAAGSISHRRPLLVFAGCLFFGSLFYRYGTVS